VSDEEEWTAESGRRADPERVVDAIASTPEFSESSDQRSLKWTDEDHRDLVRRKFEGDATEQEAILPGFGERGYANNAREDCGEAHPFVCESCGHSVEFGRTCSQSVCARCGVAWCRDAAIGKAAKIRRLRMEKHKATPDKEHQKLHHQIISPSLGWFYDLAQAGLSMEEAQQKTYEVVKEILDEMRAPGLVARHSYRGIQGDDLNDEADDMGEWKERVFHERDFYGDVRDELGWKPHYHCIVVGDWLKVRPDDDEEIGLAELVEEKTGWVIHRIEREDEYGEKRSLESDGDMAKAVTYALSHADIIVNEDGNNRSFVEEVGAFQGDIFRSSGRFSARPSDLEWADGKVREYAEETLGLHAATTECGEQIPPVDDPNELARRVLEDIWPDDDERPEWRDEDADTVLHHISEGNINVDVSTTSGSGGDVTVRDATGVELDADTWGSSVPDAAGSLTYEGADEPVAVLDERDDLDHDGGCCSDDDDEDEEDECDGSLIPLEEARRRGLLDDDDWCRDAPHVDEAREADLEWPDDLQHWRTESPGKAIGAG